MITLRQAADADVSEVRVLFQEYATSLDVELDFQDFENELASLPGAYSLPGGCLLLATDGARSVGGVGVRPLDERTCEMKRLYVRQEARGQSVGRRLVDEAVAFARAAGYRAMRLDTLPTMTAARELYRQMGFRDIAPYRYNPIPGTTFMELTLGRP